MHSAGERQGRLSEDRQSGQLKDRSVLRNEKIWFQKKMKPSDSVPRGLLRFVNVFTIHFFFQSYANNGDLIIGHCCQFIAKMAGPLSALSGLILLLVPFTVALFDSQVCQLETRGEVISINV